MNIATIGVGWTFRSSLFTSTRLMTKVAPSVAKACRQLLLSVRSFAVFGENASEKTTRQHWDATLSLRPQHLRR